MRIYSLTVSPLRPYLLALGGSSPFVFLRTAYFLIYGVEGLTRSR